MNSLYTTCYTFFITFKRYALAKYDLFMTYTHSGSHMACQSNRIESNCVYSVIKKHRI